MLCESVCEGYSRRWESHECEIDFKEHLVQGTILWWFVFVEAVPLRTCKSAGQSGLDLGGTCSPDPSADG